jgi:hypothetical protein|tara:strand:- start:126 stop:311 length:186 start_codon:yes stop_codon:yes gene_type:complete
MNYKMNVVDLFWRRVDNLEKQIEKTTDTLWKAMWKDKLVELMNHQFNIELMKNVPDRRMIN